MLGAALKRIYGTLDDWWYSGSLDNALPRNILTLQLHLSFTKFSQVWVAIWKYIYILYVIISSLPFERIINMRAHIRTTRYLPSFVCTCSTCMLHVQLQHHNKDSDLPGQGRLWSVPTACKHALNIFVLVARLTTLLLLTLLCSKISELVICYKLSYAVLSAIECWFTFSFSK